MLSPVSKLSFSSMESATLREGADENDKAAVAAAAEMGAKLTAKLSAKDVEGMAAQKCLAEFAAASAELDALMEDSSDEESIVRQISRAPRPDASNYLERLERETAWQHGHVGMEMQLPWSRLLLTGSKRLETRSYPLPAALLDRPISVLETSEATADACRPLPDVLPAGHPNVLIAGSVTFSSCFAYSSFEAFQADEARHGLPPEVTRSFSKDFTMYGWAVKETVQLMQPTTVLNSQRRLHCFYEIFSGGEGHEGIMDED